MSFRSLTKLLLWSYISNMTRKVRKDHDCFIAIYSRRTLLVAYNFTNAVTEMASISIWDWNMCIKKSPASIYFNAEVFFTEAHQYLKFQFILIKNMINFRQSTNALIYLIYYVIIPSKEIRKNLNGPYILYKSCLKSESCKTRLRTALSNFADLFGK